MSDNIQRVFSDDGIFRLLYVPQDPSQRPEATGLDDMIDSRPPEATGLDDMIDSCPVLDRCYAQIEMVVRMARMFSDYLKTIVYVLSRFVLKIEGQVAGQQGPGGCRDAFPPNLIKNVPQDAEHMSNTVFKKCDVTVSYRIVSDTQIACEIDIRTLATHQVWGQILDQILGQTFWSRMYSTWTENTVYSSTGTEKGYPLTTLFYSRPNRKRVYLLTTNDIATC